MMALSPTTRLRMKDLCAQTGLSRQAIHFYIQQGLVPEGHKTGRNMAWYGPEHVERVLLIRRLQEERFLPLKAIRALLGGEAGHLAATQRDLLLEVRARLPRPLAGAAAIELVDLKAACTRHGVDAADAARMIELGLLAVREVAGVRQVPSDAEWMLALWGRMRAAGFTRALGFTPDDLLVYDEAVTALFARETEMLTDRITGLPADRVATMLETALPLIHALIAHLHGAAVRAFFASLDTTARTEESP